MPLTTPEPVAVPLYAGFWRRAAASLLDYIVLIIPTTAINIAFQADSGMTGFILNTVVCCLYYALLHSSAKQATLGKMAFGVKVTDRAGERIGVLRGVGRYFATFISAVILMIGFMMAGFTNKKQALHDMIAGTLVVNKKADPAEVVAGGGTMPITAGVVVMMVVLFIVPFFGGIFAAIAIPAYQDYTVRAKIMDAMQTLAPLRNGIEQAYAKKEPFVTGDMPVTSPNAAGLKVSSSGEIVLTLAPSVAGGGNIVYTPTIDAAGAMTWRCTSTVPKKYLPAKCRE